MSLYTGCYGKLSKFGYEPNMFWLYSGHNLSSFGHSSGQLNQESWTTRTSQIKKPHIHCYSCMFTLLTQSLFTFIHLLSQHNLIMTLFPHHLLSNHNNQEISEQVHFWQSCIRTTRVGNSEGCKIPDLFPFLPHSFNFKSIRIHLKTIATKNFG